MRFNRRNWVKFFDGSGKTTTIRLKPVPVGHKKAWAGSYMKPELLGEFDVVAIDRVRYSNLTIFDAVSDGFRSLEELRDELNRLNPGRIKDVTDVFIHRIENVMNKGEGNEKNTKGT